VVSTVDIPVCQQDQATIADTCEREAGLLEDVALANMCKRC
jgi:hypothetical protein